MKRLIKLTFFFIIISNFTTSMADNICCANKSCCKDKCCDKYNIVYNCDCDPCCCISSLYGYPFLAYRSQSVNAARDLVGWQQYINKFDMEKYYFTFATTFEYTRSFNAKRISQFFFGKDLINCNTLKIQGSAIENRDPRAWLADYFGLPRDFESNVSFCPQIENYILDLNFYVGLDEVRRGMYLKIHAPFVYTKWQLNMCEPVQNQGTESDGLYPAGYMDEATVPKSKLAKTFTESISGSHTFGDMQAPIKFGKMTPYKIIKSRISDVQIIFGWNPIREKDYVFGLNFRVDAPTGNRPCSLYLFEPIVGNGKHWGIGAGFNSESTLWRAKNDPENYFSVWIDANLTHLVRSCQCRSFDFCGKPNSRYMLLEKMTAEIEDNLRIAPLELIQTDTLPNFDKAQVPDYQYAKKLIPAVNWSTFPIDVRVDIQADLAIKFAYVKQNWDIDFGYNLWARTGEKFSFIDNCCADCDEELYAIKGDTYIYGYRAEDIAPVALSATQSCADIHTGKNYPWKDTTDENTYPPTNPNIDNPIILTNTAIPIPGEYIAAGGNSNTGDDILVENVSATGLYTRTSFQPILVSRRQTCLGNTRHLNTEKGPSAVTHKFFAHFNYSGKGKHEDWTPFIGIGGEVEFDSWCTARRGVCQWGAWIKLGSSFE